MTLHTSTALQWQWQIINQISNSQKTPLYLALTGTLQWRHNGLDGVSKHQPYHCLLSRLFGRSSKKTSKLCVTGLCAGNSPGTGEFPTQMASNAGNVSIWWRHHATMGCLLWFVLENGKCYNGSALYIVQGTKYTRILVQQLMQTIIDENIKTLHYWAFLTKIHRLPVYS